MRNRISRAYTLVEILITVAILGTAVALVAPTMGDSETLRIHAALRAVVADITFAQSDALAFQQRRAIVFDNDANSYAIYEVNGATLDEVNDVLDSNFGVGGKYIRDLTQTMYAGADIVDSDFGFNGTIAFGDAILVFDEMAGPTSTLVGDSASLGGFVEISGSSQTFRVNVAAFTGRVTIQKMP